ncbi:MAG: macro domain-containing protein [Scytonema sp. PMC 1069.18]|nr:macro domain-containing protein [Scytonema sp. PMC 1069.18]MEC4887262.1 macro domain-containing protein [Scytonema sp. PMC 1070.18]
MIEFKQGNLLEEKAEALVNTVNCVGVMGKGIALQFKRAYPENFRQYEKACKASEVQPGRMFTVATGSLFNPRYIINFPTQLPDVRVVIFENPSMSFSYFFSLS